ncbi:hypothetical protein PC120_g17924 [Phytophthora cactorum]|nr:hypothetical protein PC120_g17924 [Phytophthora cactorum]
MLAQFPELDFAHPDSEILKVNHQLEDKHNVPSTSLRDYITGAQDVL